MVEAPKSEIPSQEAPPEARKPANSGIRAIRWVVLALLIGAAAYGGSNLWRYLQSFEDTDDAQIDGDIYTVTSRIAGTVAAVHVQDNDRVRAGQLLVELDPADYELAVEEAKASLNESRSEVSAASPNVPIVNVSTETAISALESDVVYARAQVAAAQRDLESAAAQIRQAEADNAKAQADLVRYRQLVAKDEISRQQFDQAEAAARSMAATVDARRAAAEAAARNIEAAEAKLQSSLTRAAEARRNRPRQIELQSALVRTRQANTLQEQVKLEQAKLNLGYLKIIAPVDGIVGRKNVAPGQRIEQGQQLMVDVPAENLWVTANFKETQLKEMKLRQRATVHVDATGRDYEGYVESVAAASGARFSLLPPENATGNYVKVVQRLPVRIRLKEGQDPERRLRPGMSAEPKVWLDK